MDSSNFTAAKVIAKLYAPAISGYWPRLASNRRLELQFCFVLNALD
jgi:hypothetical protein